MRTQPIWLHACCSLENERKGVHGANLTCLLGWKALEVGYYSSISSMSTLLSSVPTEKRFWLPSSNFWPLLMPFWLSVDVRALESFKMSPSLNLLINYFTPWWARAQKFDVTSRKSSDESWKLFSQFPRSLSLLVDVMSPADKVRWKKYQERKNKHFSQTIVIKNFVIQTLINCKSFALFLM